MTEVSDNKPKSEVLLDLINKTRVVYAFFLRQIESGPGQNLKLDSEKLTLIAYLDRNHDKHNNL